MTIKWGDPIECNGVRPDWLRDDEPAEIENRPGEWLEWGVCVWHRLVAAVRLPADHPAYVALARGFTPWSGGESAPIDADLTNGALLRNGMELHGNVSTLRYNHEGKGGDVIGYRKRNTEPHLARIEVEGSAPVDGVFIKRMTPAAIVERWTEALSPDGTYEDDVVEFCRRLGLVQDETLAERFTRETGHAVTEAVEAALNWKGE